MEKLVNAVLVDCGSGASCAGNPGEMRSRTTDVDGGLRRGRAELVGTDLSDDGGGAGG